jgi:hypothetical protein
MNSGFLWIIIASIAGFGIAAISTDVLKLRRNIFLLFYIPVVAILFLAFVSLNHIDLNETLRYNWYWGLVGAVLAAAFVLRNVFSQPPSPRSKGGALFLDVFWPGLTYGMMDAILLSVLPVMALRLALIDGFWTEDWTGRIIFGVSALVASFFVTTAYHWGFP